MPSVNRIKDYWGHFSTSLSLSSIRAQFSHFITRSGLCLVCLSDKACAGCAASRSNKHGWATILMSKSKQIQKPLQGFIVTLLLVYMQRHYQIHLIYLMYIAFFVHTMKANGLQFGSQISSKFLFMFHRIKNQTGLEPHKGEKMTIFILGGEFLSQ